MVTKLWNKQKRYFFLLIENQKSKAGEKRYTAKDAVANGLFLDITTTGVKSWWYRYSLHGKQERFV
jgi:hypothetical protein